MRHRGHEVWAHIVFTPRVWWRRTTHYFHLSGNVDDVTTLFVIVRQNFPSALVTLHFDPCDEVRFPERRGPQRFKFGGEFIK